MTRPLKERLASVRSIGARRGKPWNPDGPEAIARIERLEDSVEGLTEDLYQAVLVAYRRGAEEWARLNYPQWIDAMKAGREASPPRAHSVGMSGANEQ